MSAEPIAEPIKDIEGWIPIRIEGPLPMGVAGTLMTTIGHLWPDAVIKPGGKKYGYREYALDLRIPPDTPAQTLDEEFIEQMQKETKDDGSDFLGFDDDGWVAFAPPEELCLYLGSVAHAIMIAHEPEAVNHVEWTIKTGNEPEDPSYVLSISRSKAQTPLAMRKNAEAEIERLKAILDEKGIEY